jgi:hypothetical protein
VLDQPDRRPQGRYVAELGAQGVDSMLRCPPGAAQQGLRDVVAQRQVTAVVEDIELSLHCAAAVTVRGIAFASSTGA